MRIMISKGKGILKAITQSHNHNHLKTITITPKIITITITPKTITITYSAEWREKILFNRE